MIQQPPRKTMKTNKVYIYIYTYIRMCVCISISIYIYISRTALHGLTGRSSDFGFNSRLEAAISFQGRSHIEVYRLKHGAHPG